MSEASLTAPGEPPTDPHEAVLLGDLYRRHVHMVLFARKGAGSWGEDDQLTSFRIYLSEPVVVRINGEPHGWAQPRARRDVVPGEVVAFGDVESAAVPLPADEGPPFFAARLVNNRWAVAYDLRRSAAKVSALLAAGDEFMRAAETALEAEALRAFTENAFHSVESFAKAELLSFPIVSSEVEGSRKHSALQSAYDLWARLENTDERFPALLRELERLRSAATYADRDFTLALEDAHGHLAVMKELRTHARSVVTPSTGRVIKVIATRPIEAGESIREDDATIRPPRRGKSHTSQS